MERPSSKQVAERLILLRFQFDHAADPPGNEAQRRVFWDRLEGLGLAGAMSAADRRLAETTRETLSEEQRTRAERQIEAIAVLMWMLGEIAELPPYTVPADRSLAGRVPIERGQRFVRDATLKPLVDVYHARELAKLWHWRAQIRRRVAAGECRVTDPKLRSAGFKTLNEVVRFSAGKAYEEGVLPVLVEEDFPVGAKAYRDLDPEEFAEVAEIAGERLRAFNWTCGFSPRNSWDDRPTE